MICSPLQQKHFLLPMAIMGLTTWKKAPDEKILKSDVVIAKNYLNEKEIKFLNRIVTMYLDYAENQAERGIPVTMSDWTENLNAFLKLNNAEVLKNAGKVTADIAKSFAESEFEKHRPIQTTGLSNRCHPRGSPLF